MVQGEVGTRENITRPTNNKRMGRRARVFVLKQNYNVALKLL
jgi:hypothetical protein